MGEDRGSRHYLGSNLSRHTLDVIWHSHRAGRLQFNILCEEEREIEKKRKEISWRIAKWFQVYEWSESRSPLFSSLPIASECVHLMLVRFFEFALLRFGFVMSKRDFNRGCSGQLRSAVVGIQVGVCSLLWFSFPLLLIRTVDYLRLDITCGHGEVGHVLVKGLHCILKAEFFTSSVNLERLNTLVLSFVMLYWGGIQLIKPG